MATNLIAGQTEACLCGFSGETFLARLVQWQSITAMAKRASFENAGSYLLYNGGVWSLSESRWNENDQPKELDKKEKIVNSANHEISGLYAFVFHRTQLKVISSRILRNYDVNCSENLIGRLTLLFCNKSSIIPSHLAWKMFINFPGVKLEWVVWKWKQKLKICRQVLTSSTQLQNTSFHVVVRTRSAVKWTKMKIACTKRAKLLF